MNEGWVTKDKVADHLGVSLVTIDRLVGKGLPSVKLDEARGGARRFRLSDVDEWIQKHGNGVVPA